MKPRRPVAVSAATYDLVVGQLDEVVARLEYLAETSEERVPFLLWSVREQVAHASALLHAYDPDSERFAKWRSKKEGNHGNRRRRDDDGSVGGPDSGAIGGDAPARSNGAGRS